MKSSEIRVLKERFSRAVSFSILLTVLTNIVSMFFVMGSEAWAESVTLDSIQPFYVFEEESSEKLCQSRLPKETCSQQVNEKAPENTDPLTSLINAFEHIIRGIAGYFETIIKH